MAFKEYKGLNLSQVADEVLVDWEKNNSFQKSISIRMELPNSFFMKDLLQQMECLVFIMSWQEA